MVVRGFGDPNRPYPIPTGLLPGESRSPAGVGISEHDNVESLYEEAHLRRSVEYDVVQPDVDHVEEPMI